MTEITEKRSRVGERTFVAVCWLTVLLPLAMLAVLVGDVFLDGLERLDWSFLRGVPSRRASAAGIWPSLVGSLYLILVTAVLALPLGIGAAVYLEEYGHRNRIAGIIEVTIANLAGVPSVIYGLLGLEFFVRFAAFGPSLLAGSCTMALLVLPIVIMAAREALRTVPNDLREAGYALGATRWQMVRQVVLPMAVPGMLTGAILAISRAIGETAPLIVIGAVVYISFIPDGLGSDFTALPLQIFNWVSMPQREFLTNAAAAIIVLLATLVAVNGAAILLRNRYQRRNY